MWAAGASSELNPFANLEAKIAEQAGRGRSRRGDDAREGEDKPSEPGGDRKGNEAGQDADPYADYDDTEADRSLPGDQSRGGTKGLQHDSRAGDAAFGGAPVRAAEKILSSRPPEDEGSTTAQEGREAGAGEDVRDLLQSEVAAGPSTEQGGPRAADGASSEGRAGEDGGVDWAAESMQLEIDEVAAAEAAEGAAERAAAERKAAREAELREQQEREAALLAEAAAREAQIRQVCLQTPSTSSMPSGLAVHA